MEQHRLQQTDDLSLTVEVIDTYADFERLRPIWDALEARDPEANLFLSWRWMAEAFRDNRYRWSVCVATESGAPGRALAILPLKYRLHWSSSRQEFQTEIEAGGRLIWSEYTGFLCDPHFEKAALSAIAGKLAAMPWVRLSMRYVAQERRSRLFTEAFDSEKFSSRFRGYLINGKQTNNLLCPQVDLPEDFDVYLRTQISTNRRQQYKRFKRNHLDTGEYHIRLADDSSVEADLTALLDFWTAKWSESKGMAQAKRVAANYRDVLSAAHRIGALHLPVLYRGDTPLGALGHVVDHSTGLMHFIVAGRDEAASEPFIGAALHFSAIEWAIGEGLICYDFCHGNEAYKYSYGAQDLEVKYFEVRRSSPEDDMVLDSISVGAAMKRVATFLERGEAEKATRACNQIADLFS